MEGGKEGRKEKRGRRYLSVRGRDPVTAIDKALNKKGMGCLEIQLWSP